MSDCEKELLADLDSDGDSDIESLEINGEKLAEEDGPKSQVVSFEDQIKQLLDTSVHETLHTVLNSGNVEEIQDFGSFSKILPLVPELKSRIAKYANEEDSDYLELLSFVNDGTQSEEYKFILTINEISTVINNEISVFHLLLKSQYKIVFPELETLILNSIDYATIILVIKQDLENIKQYESQMKAVVTNEKVLIIIMAALHQVKSQFKLSENDESKLLQCARILLELDDMLKQLSTFITHKLSKFAPNVSAIVGPITTSQLLIATGSLRQLALTPACNLASLGVKDLSSQTKKTSNKIRQSGYLFHSEIVKFLPDDIVRSSMRIISGKVILAARIDLANSSPSGVSGLKYSQEIQQKIDKLLTPPEQVPDKALPLPIDQKSKKRGGKRFRKMKERLQMSELRKAQNKMGFGTREDSVVDGFGEEIGLGMSRSNGTGRIGEIKINTNTSARMSKAMVSRLQQYQQSENIDNIILANPNNQPTNRSTLNLPSTTTNKWFSGITKRKLEISINGESDKPDKKPRLDGNNGISH
jgi:U4/U6 small nuclear ribonucleoprotein PRP31